MKKLNIFEKIPGDLSSEIFEDVIHSKTVRIERIISKGHSSPEAGWYDQEENEWVIVLSGKAQLAFDDGTTLNLGAGDYLDIPAHCKHKVISTDAEEPTVWLAVFYR